MRPLLFFVVAMLCLAAPVAQAEPGALRSLDTEEAVQGFKGIGRLDIGPSKFCTATLVAPTLVLTAAHCVFDKENGTPHPPEALTFRAGFRNGRSEAALQVRRMVVHNSYRHIGRPTIRSSEGDVALLELERTLDVPGVQPFAPSGTVARGERVQVISYARTRSEAPSQEAGCDVLDRDAQLLILSCEVDFGASGAPVLIDTGDALQMVALISAMADVDGRTVAVAVPVQFALSEMVSELSATPSLPPVRKALRVEDRNSGTIRFIRP